MSTTTRQLSLNCCLLRFAVATGCWTVTCGSAPAESLAEANQLNTVAVETYQRAGDHETALKLLERAVLILERTVGPEHPKTGIALDNLATSHRNLGNHAKALPLQERALAIFEESYGPSHKSTAIALDNLAGTHSTLGNFQKALPLQERSLAIFQEVLGESHPSIGTCLNNLAQTYCDLGDYEKGLSLQEKAVAITELSLGESHPNRIAHLMALGVNYNHLGRYEEAVDAIEKARLVANDVIEGPHPLKARILHNLAGCYYYLNEHQKASALEVQALEMRKKLSGAQHPETILTLQNLAVSTYYQGNDADAKAHVEELIELQQRNLESVLSLDEESRLSWQAENISYWFANLLSPNKLAQLLLRWKGVVLDSLIEDRALILSTSGDPRARAKLEEISQLRADLAKTAFDSSQKAESDRLKDQISRIERSLSEKSGSSGTARTALGVTLEQILPALGEHAVLIDLFRFSDLREEGSKRRCYGAVIVDGLGNVSFTQISDADGIDQAVDLLRTALLASDSKGVEKFTELLSAKLWAPLSQSIAPSARQLIVCPDSKLSFLSLACLLDAQAKFVGESFTVSYVGSSRNLARKPGQAPGNTLAVFADPIFDASSKLLSSVGPANLRAAEADAFGGINLAPLPGTQAEAQQLQLIGEQADWDVHIKAGKEATESSVREIEKPAILHLATHGFYLNSHLPAADDGTRGMSVVGLKTTETEETESGVDPMRASGVALTGAQQTLKLWSQRKAPDPETDGILTAEEVASLDLNGTWLVTLSACETGVGEARSGEGVFGLRRAFMMAGAENLLMTLWPVADDTTASIMADFYKEALATGDAPGSLAKVQRDWLVKLREEKGLATAIREAGPFAMVCMTSPRLKLEPKNSEKPDEVVASAERTSDKTVPDNHEVRKVQKEIDELKALIKVDGAAKSKSAPKTVPKTRAKSDYRRELEDAKKQSEKLKAIIESSE